MPNVRKYKTCSKLIKNIVFDADGTLYASRQLKNAVIERMINYLSQKLGITPQKAQSLRKQLLNREGVESTEYVFKKYYIDYSDLIKSTYLSVDLEKYVPFDHQLKKMLENLPQRKAILTNNPSEFIEAILLKLGIRDMFEFIIGSREINFKLKPCPYAFKTMFKITSFVPSATLYVDDKEGNLEIAKNFGMRTALIMKRNYHIKKLPYVDYYIFTIYDLEEVVEHESYN